MEAVPCCMAAQQVHSPPREPPPADTLYCREVVDPSASETWECFAKLPHGNKQAMAHVTNNLHGHGGNVTPYYCCPAGSPVIRTKNPTVNYTKLRKKEEGHCCLQECGYS